ncbi:MAG: acetyl/propionyl/methylcrotonyl-CoA carboxylase subunit alpha [Pseudomonadota bacterium]
MFRKILVANRGEIACRVIATARKLGIATVAVYSDADAGARHVALADEAVHIGPPAVAESYLQADRIIEACRLTGAEAIHPGYGFLSENPAFVEAVEAAGLVFIGPTAHAIQAMGLKDAAKALMFKAGVPVVPGYHGPDQNPDFLAAKAGKIGYPVLIKARAGGGGKGMRRVEGPADFKPALESAQREAEASFGDPVCLIEKYIAHPRHIEIQVFGDKHGNVIHLFERDCSLQRRHQKVIEEAPAPDMPETVRAAMGKAAVDAAKAISYTGAGTVEFIVDGSRPLREDGFWFMEMNTRLQVEHPVSEAITGLDFVDLQLRVAAGEPLPVAQADLSINGWAFEARVYAEDVGKGFLPATGTLEHLIFPKSTEFSAGPVRIDSGVQPGDKISPWYDPMIAKIIVHAPTRPAALNLLRSALEQTHVTGAVTNLEFLRGLARHEGFGRGKVDTGLIDRDLGTLTAKGAPPAPVSALAALGGLGLLRRARGSDPWDCLVGWRHWTDAMQFATLDHDGTRLDVQVSPLGDGRFKVDSDAGALNMSVVPVDAVMHKVSEGGRIYDAHVLVQKGAVSVSVAGETFSFGLPDATADADSDAGGGDTLIAPMPGLVKLVSVKPGAKISKGDRLLVLEAMKMEHSLTAPRDGVVADVHVSEGAQVTDGTVLLALEPDNA